jgi:hypothetical protein
MKKVEKDIPKLLKQTRENAESLGFSYRACGESGWITFTYPGTNSHVIHIDLLKTDDIMKKLGDELVRCGRIQCRQNFLREFSSFNYD